MFKYGVIFGPNAGKYEPEITPYIGHFSRSGEFPHFLQISTQVQTPSSHVSFQETTYSFFNPEVSLSKNVLLGPY